MMSNKSLLYGLILVEGAFNVYHKWKEAYLNQHSLQHHHNKHHESSFAKFAYKEICEYPSLMNTLTPFIQQPITEKKLMYYIKHYICTHDPCHETPHQDGLYSFGNGPIQSTYKPFSFYASIYCVRFFYSLYLQWKGYKKYKTHGSVWFVKQEIHPQKEWIVFIHGAGIGLSPYHTLITELETKYNVVLCEVNAVSFDVFSSPPDPDEYGKQLEIIMKEHNIKEIHVLTHSYGAYILVHLLQYNDKVIHRKFLCEPVCFHISQGHIYSLNRPNSFRHFLYDQLISTKTPKEKKISFLQWFHFNDISVHHLYLRRNKMYQLVMRDEWFTDTFVCLAEDDYVIPFQPLSHYLEHYHIPYSSYKGTHGDYILKHPSSVLSLFMDMVAR